MLMGRPTCPVSRLREGEANQQPSSLDIFSNQDVKVPLLAWRSRAEFQRRVLRDFRVGDKLQRIALLNLGRKFCEVNLVICRYFDLAVAWNVDSVVLSQPEVFAAGFHRSRTGKTNQRGFAVTVGKRYCRIGAVQDDAAVGQMPVGAVTGID